MMPPNKSKKGAVAIRDSSPEPGPSTSKRAKRSKMSSDDEEDMVPKSKKAPSKFVSKSKRSGFAAHNKPAELFRKDLISAMKLPDSEPLQDGSYFLISDPWRQEWEKGVQVPVNMKEIVKTDVRPIRDRNKGGDFKMPLKMLHERVDSTYKKGLHELTGMQQLAEQLVRYDLDDLDVSWLEEVNFRRREMGLDQVNEWNMERVMEALENQCHEKMQAVMKTEEGMGIEYDEDIVCDVCRSPESEDTNEMVFCDGCDICIHQACYGIQSIPEGTWLCRTCALGIKPNCILCPEEGGAMKSTRSGTKWAHVSCALWIPEVSIGIPEKMEPITKISNIPPSRWALVCCLCKERVGACIQCSVKTCKTAFHVTCGFANNLEMRTVLDDTDEGDGVKLKAYCPKHSRKERDRSVSESSDCESPPRMDSPQPTLKKEMTQQERDNLRAQKLKELEEDFFSLVDVSEVCDSLQLDHEIVDLIFMYWKLKRKCNWDKALLTPKTEEADMLEKQQEDSLVARMKMFVSLRQDLERVRNLCYMIGKREKTKRQFLRSKDYVFTGMVRVLLDKSLTLSKADVDDVIHNYHFNSIYDDYGRSVPNLPPEPDEMIPSTSSSGMEMVKLEKAAWEEEKEERERVQASAANVVKDTAAEAKFDHSLTVEDEEEEESLNVEDTSDNLVVEEEDSSLPVVETKNLAAEEERNVSTAERKSETENGGSAEAEVVGASQQMTSALEDKPATAEETAVMTMEEEEEEEEDPNQDLPPGERWSGQFVRSGFFMRRRPKKWMKLKKKKQQQQPPLSLSSAALSSLSPELPAPTATSTPAHHVTTLEKTRTQRERDNDNVFTSNDESDEDKEQLMAVVKAIVDETDEDDDDSDVPFSAAPAGPDSMAKSLKSRPFALHHHHSRKRNLKRNKAWPKKALHLSSSEDESSVKPAPSDSRGKKPGGGHGDSKEVELVDVVGLEDSLLSTVPHLRNVDVESPEGGDRRTIKPLPVQSSSHTSLSLSTDTRSTNSSRKVDTNAAQSLSRKQSLKKKSDLDDSLKMLSEEVSSPKRKRTETSSETPSPKKKKTEPDNNTQKMSAESRPKKKKNMCDETSSSSTSSPSKKKSEHDKTSSLTKKKGEKESDSSTPTGVPDVCSSKPSKKKSEKDSSSISTKTVPDKHSLTKKKSQKEFDSTQTEPAKHKSTKTKNEGDSDSTRSDSERHSPTKKKSEKESEGSTPQTTPKKHKSIKKKSARDTDSVRSSDTETYSPIKTHKKREKELDSSTQKTKPEKCSPTKKKSERDTSSTSIRSSDTDKYSPTKKKTEKELDSSFQTVPEKSKSTRKKNERDGGDSVRSSDTEKYSPIKTKSEKDFDISSHQKTPEVCSPSKKKTERSVQELFDLVQKEQAIASKQSSERAHPVSVKAENMTKSDNKKPKSRQVKDFDCRKTCENIIEKLEKGISFNDLPERGETGVKSNSSSNPLKRDMKKEPESQQKKSSSKSKSKSGSDELLQQSAQQDSEVSAVEGMKGKSDSNSSPPKKHDKSEEKRKERESRHKHHESRRSKRHHRSRHSNSNAESDFSKMASVPDDNDGLDSSKTSQAVENIAPEISSNQSAAVHRAVDNTNPVKQKSSQKEIPSSESKSIEKAISVSEEETRKKKDFEGPIGRLLASPVRDSGDRRRTKRGRESSSRHRNNDDDDQETVETADLFRSLSTSSGTFKRSLSTEPANIFERMERSTSSASSSSGHSSVRANIFESMQRHCREGSLNFGLKGSDSQVTESLGLGVKSSDSQLTESLGLKISDSSEGLKTSDSQLTEPLKPSLSLDWRSKIDFHLGASDDSSKLSQTPSQSGNSPLIQDGTDTGDLNSSLSPLLDRSLKMDEETAAEAIKLSQSDVVEPPPNAADSGIVDPLNTTDTGSCLSAGVEATETAHESNTLSQTSEDRPCLDSDNSPDETTTDGVSSPRSSSFAVGANDENETTDSIYSLMPCLTSKTSQDKTVESISSPRPCLASSENCDDETTENNSSPGPCGIALDETTVVSSPRPCFGSDNGPVESMEDISSSRLCLANANGPDKTTKVITSSRLSLVSENVPYESAEGIPTSSRLCFVSASGEDESTDNIFSPKPCLASVNSPDKTMKGRPCHGNENSPDETAEGICSPRPCLASESVPDESTVKDISSPRPGLASKHSPDDMTEGISSPRLCLASENGPDETTENISSPGPCAIAPDESTEDISSPRPCLVSSENCPADENTEDMCSPAASEEPLYQPPPDLLSLSPSMAPFLYKVGDSPAVATKAGSLSPPPPPTPSYLAHSQPVPPSSPLAVTDHVSPSVLSPGKAPCADEDDHESMPSLPGELALSSSAYEISLPEPDNKAYEISLPEYDTKARVFSFPQSGSKADTLVVNAKEDVAKNIDDIILIDSEPERNATEDMIMVDSEPEHFEINRHGKTYGARLVLEAKEEEPEDLNFEAVPMSVERNVQFEPVKSEESGLLRIETDDVKNVASGLRIEVGGVENIQRNLHIKTEKPVKNENTDLQKENERERDVQQFVETNKRADVYHYSRTSRCSTNLTGGAVVDAVVTSDVRDDKKLISKFKIIKRTAAEQPTDGDNRPTQPALEILKIPASKLLGYNKRPHKKSKSKKRDKSESKRNVVVVPVVDTPPPHRSTPSQPEEQHSPLSSVYTHSRERSSRRSSVRLEEKPEDTESVARFRLRRKSSHEARLKLSKVLASPDSSSDDDFEPSQPVASFSRRQRHQRLSKKPERKHRSSSRRHMSSEERSLGEDSEEEEEKVVMRKPRGEERRRSVQWEASVFKEKVPHPPLPPPKEAIIPILKPSSRSFTDALQPELSKLLKPADLIVGEDLVKRVEQSVLRRRFRHNHNHSHTNGVMEDSRSKEQKLTRAGKDLKKKASRLFRDSKCLRSSSAEDSSDTTTPVVVTMTKPPLAMNRVLNEILLPPEGSSGNLQPISLFGAHYSPLGSLTGYKIPKKTSSSDSSPLPSATPVHLLPQTPHPPPPPPVSLAPPSHSLTGLPFSGGADFNSFKSLAAVDLDPLNVAEGSQHDLSISILKNALSMRGSASGDTTSVTPYSMLRRGGRGDHHNHPFFDDSGCPASLDSHRCGGYRSSSSPATSDVSVPVVGSRDSRESTPRRCTRSQLIADNSVENLNSSSILQHPGSSGSSLRMKLRDSRLKAPTFFSSS